MYHYKNNELVYMSRRYPSLPNKVLKRDSKIANRITLAWDVEHNPVKVLSIFLKEKDNLSPERYWEIMRSVWIITGSVDNSPVFRDLMLSNKRSKYYFSTPEEAKKLRELPESFEVYRATNDEKDGGLSWTLSKEYAEWYREVYHKSKIVTRTVCKEDIFAVIERNKESEVIIL